MPINLDQAFGIHAQALVLRARRAGVLAENLAHADTPGYKARDVDFQALLANAAKGNSDTAGSLHITHNAHFGDSKQHGLNSHELLYRVPSAPSLDGNTVDTQVEQAKFSENAMQYLTSLNFLNGTIRGLLTAIKGE